MKDIRLISLLLIFSVLFTFSACSRSAEPTSPSEEQQSAQVQENQPTSESEIKQDKSETEDDLTHAENEQNSESADLPHQKTESDNISDKDNATKRNEKEILSTQAELLTKQIVSASHPKLSPQLSEQSVWEADDEIIERFWLTIGIYDKEPNYPYPDTYQMSSDGVLRFSEETIQTITKEVFGQDISPKLIEYDDKEQVYYYTIGFGVSAYGFEKMTTTFQNNNSEILVSYELWSDPNFPMYQKIDDYQSLFAVKQREDNSYYLQYVKTEKTAAE